MEASDHSSMASLCLSHSSSNSTFQTTDFPPNLLRQWRPNAQRNLKNQWSKLSALRNQWFSSSSSARSHATSLVNSYLSSRYLDDMNLGVLSDMPNIRNKARCKFLKQQELQLNKLLASYKSMVVFGRLLWPVGDELLDDNTIKVGVVVDMINSSRSLRCYLKATSGSPLIEFTSSAANSNDSGDGGGATVFTFLAISAFEMLAEELSEMFKQELLLKRLLVVELLSVTFQKHELFTQLSWAEDLYHGEADDLSTCSVYSKETAKPSLPKLNGCRPDSAYLESDKHPSNDILQVYLTTWLAEVNIDTYRVEQIFATAGEEMRTSFA